MIEHKYLDLFVDYTMKRTNADLMADISMLSLFSHLVLVSFSFYCVNVPLSLDSVSILTVILYTCDAFLFGNIITFSYSSSTACRMASIFLILLIYVYFRFLSFFNIFSHGLALSKAMYSRAYDSIIRIYDIILLKLTRR